MIITVSNLFPRPDQPTRGMYNYQLFKEMGKVIGNKADLFGGVHANELERSDTPESRIQNVCLVPEWRIWRWRGIRRWRMSEFRIPTLYIPVFYIPFLGRSINWWFCFRGLKREVALSLNQSTIFYVPWLFPDGVAVARAIRGSGARLWLMVLGSDTFHLKSSARRQKIFEACEQAEGIVCVAQVLADRLAAAGVPLAKLHVVPNGVDTSLFRVRSKEETPLSLMGTEPHYPGPLSQGEREYGNSRRILFIGNLVPVKGPDVMLRAFSLLCETTQGSGNKVISPELLIIGSGPMRRQLERKAHQLGIAERVHFLGNRSHTEVARWMNMADVLCLTSRSEGMPNVVVEALASGLPVVATAVGACPELLAGEPAARLCPSGDVRAIADGLMSVLDSKINRQAMATGHAHHYSWHWQAESLLNMIGQD
jgi:glycosyltransferase involved in cell wall biosynthesis